MSYNVGGEQIDTVQEIENIWSEQRESDFQIQTYKDGNAAAWSVTCIAYRYLAVPRVIRTSHYGTSFGLDVFDVNLGEQARLSTIFTLDNQPNSVVFFKSLLLVSTSYPQSLIYVLDALLLKKLAVISLQDVAKCIDVIERPLYQHFDMIVATQSCGRVDTYSINEGQVVISEIGSAVLQIGTVFKTLNVFESLFVLCSDEGLHFAELKSNF